MIKIETHCHSMGGSPCGNTDPKLIAKKYNEAGYKAIVLTNHVNVPSYEMYSASTHKGKIDYYFSLVDVMKKACAPYNIKIFFGCEVRVKTLDDSFQEYMLYGFDKSFLYDNPPLFNFTQRELFEKAVQKGLFMYQTHPFREGIKVGDPKFMHGAESFNGHYNHNNNNGLAEKFCIENNLIQMAGTDFHHPDQPVKAGMYIEDCIKDEKELTEYLFSRKATLAK